MPTPASYYFTPLDEASCTTPTQFIRPIGSSTGPATDYELCAVGEGWGVIKRAGQIYLKRMS